MSLSRSRLLFKALGLAGLLLLGTHGWAQPGTSGTPAAPTTPATPATPATGTDAPKSEELLPKFIIEDSTETPEAPKYRVVKDAMDLFVKRDFDKARKTFEEARLNYKELPPAEILMTRMLIAAKQPQLARAELEQCVRTNEADPEPYLYFAEAAISEGRVTDAAAVIGVCFPKLQAYKENLYRKNNLVKRYFSINAAVAEARKQWDDAKKSLEEWIKLDPKAAAAHQRLARVLFQSNSKDPNIYKELEIAATIEKSLPSPNISMAQLFESLNDATGRETATKYVEAAVSEKVDANNKDRVLKSFLTATQFAVATNKLNDAVKYADGALKIDPASLDAQLTRGIVARMTRDFKTAEAQLDALNAKYPINFAVSNNLALVLAEQTEPAKKERAVQLATLNFNNNKQNQQLAVEAAATLGWTYYKSGKLPEAEQVLQAVIQSNQLTADSAYYVARVLADRGRNADALNIVNVALQTPVFFNKVDAEALQKKLAATAETGGKEAPRK